ncbi:O-antigen ligase family protein [Patescibacteria group bacterium]|nr:O-antigen ligase family protein [Patescibacteria group bacterium]
MFTSEVKKIGLLVLLGFGLYLLSFVGYLSPVLNSVFFWVILFVAAFFTVKKLEYGVLFLLFELAIGVKGYLFSFNLLGFVVSLRLALFALVFLIWLYRVIKEKKPIRFAQSKLFPVYALFTLYIVVGMILGLAHGNSLKNVFFDVNGYFYFALAFPLFQVFYTKKAYKKLISVLIAGGITISLFSLFVALEFTFLHQDSRPDLAEAVSTELTLEDADDEEMREKLSHSVTAKDELKESFGLSRNFENQKPPIYRWTQDVSIAEISYLAGPFFRVFSPGQIYSLALFIIALFFLFHTFLSKSKKEVLLKLPRWFLIGALALSGVVVILGFSRSLWLGMLAAIIYGLFSVPFKKAMKIVFCGVVVLIIAVLLLVFLAPSAYSLIEGRVTSIINPSQESSGSNRINVLGPALDQIWENPLFGTGYGTTIEYESVVPEKYGTLRVFAFEWAYLDTIIEIGVVGLFLYFVLLFSVITRLGYRGYVFYQALLFALLVANITTPYLNHPLGIGLVLIGMVLAERKAIHKKSK